MNLAHRNASCDDLDPSTPTTTRSLVWALSAVLIDLSLLFGNRLADTIAL
jgi:hypothetical protein